MNSARTARTLHHASQACMVLLMLGACCIAVWTLCEVLDGQPFTAICLGTVDIFLVFALSVLTPCVYPASYGVTELLARHMHVRLVWMNRLTRHTRRLDALCLLGLGVFALIPRLLLSSGGTFDSDMACWFHWSAVAVSKSFQSFYDQSSSDYLPGYVYILWLLGRLYDPLQHVVLSVTGWHLQQTTFFKLPAILTDTATVLLLYIAGRRWFSPLTGMLAAAAYAANPAVIFNSTRWGQVDSVAAFPMTLAVVLFVEDCPIACGIAIAVSALIKPTALIL